MQGSNRERPLTQTYFQTPGSRCKHLGLKDDAATCLAYPSAKNYCHRASPPASARLSYQEQYCLTSLHYKCVVFRAMRIKALPRDIRGKQSATKHGFGGPAPA